MPKQKKFAKNKQLKTELAKELNFLKNVFSIISVPLQSKGENEDDNYEIVNNANHSEKKELTKRAHSIAELEQKLETLKSQNKFNLKNKLVKKSLSSKISKIKKRDKKSKVKVKLGGSNHISEKSKKAADKAMVNVAKPVFNTDGKLVFSKFDFADIGNRDRTNKVIKDPKKMLENLTQQNEKFKKLEETEAESKVKEIKEKIAWKNILQKAEGQKIKDDPTLLKKSIKKKEQKKKHSQKHWENRIKNVEQKKEERQKKRKENISKKKKEKKSKVIKAAVKRGRVVI